MVRSGAYGLHLRDYLARVVAGSFCRAGRGRMEGSPQEMRLISDGLRTCVMEASGHRVVGRPDRRAVQTHDGTR